jgi:hypothetical protein
MCCAFAHRASLAPRPRPHHLAELRPIHRSTPRNNRCRRTPPLALLRHLCACSCWLCVVSKTAMPFCLFLVHSNAFTGSLEWPFCPLPTPSAVDARASLENPWLSEHASPLRVAPIHTWFGHRELSPEHTQAKRRRAVPVSSAPAAAPRLHASSAIRFKMDARDRIPLRL